MLRQPEWVPPWRPHTNMIETEEKQKKAFLVGIQTPELPEEKCRELLDELSELTDTLGLEVVGSVIAKQREPNIRFLLGEGRARQIAEAAVAFEADVIIFDDFLTPSQQRNWENMADIAVIDRQEVILDIFARHARSSEAVLQVELARATYSLPRLKRRWTHLNRQRGMAGGMGMRGEGEQQIELDSRIVRMKIAKLKARLEEVRRQRQVQRAQRLRKPVPVAAIVGYTNAGKSSLLNALTDAGVLVEDKLFATLDPTVRGIILPKGQKLLLADTVGFIRRLPHLLVEAFKSTLEETVLAEHIVEVLDASSPDLDEHHDTTVKVLEEIGANSRGTIIVMNKVDLLHDELSRQRLRHRFPDAIMCSAKTGEGLDELKNVLEQCCMRNTREEEILVPHSNLSALSHIREIAAVLSEKYEEGGARLKIRIPKAAWPLVKEYAVNQRRDTSF